MKRFSIGIAVLMTVAVLGCSSEPPAGHSDELEAYLEEVRASGMTESARGSLQTVAGIILGHNTLSCTKDESSGLYWTSYHSRVCPAPGLSNEQREGYSAGLATELKPVIGLLKGLADLDGSGFVTSREASEFRAVFEFGRKAAAIVEFGVTDREKIAIGAGVAVAEFDGRIAEYRELAGKAELNGVSGFVGFGVGRQNSSSGSYSDDLDGRRNHVSSRDRHSEVRQEQDVLCQMGQRIEGSLRVLCRLVQLWEGAVSGRCHAPGRSLRV